MYLFKQVKRNVRGRFTNGTWRQPPSSSISREQSHTGHQGLTDVESEQENPSRKYMQMKQRKDRHCILFPPLPPLFQHELSSDCLSCSCWKRPMEEFGTSTASSVPTAPMWVLLGNRMCGQILAKVNGSWLSQGRKLFSRSGRKLLSRSTRKQHIIPRTGLCTKQEQSRTEQGLLHLF